MENERGIGERLAVIEVHIKELVEVNKSRGEDHERRIRAMERWMYALPPALLISVASIALTLVAILRK